MSAGYEISFSITAVCPCCGDDLPPNSYMTVSNSTGHPLERDNPYERKDRRVFITPCAKCFIPKPQAIDAAMDAVKEPR